MLNSILALIVFDVCLSCGTTQNKPFLQTQEINIQLKNHLVNKLNKYNSLKVNPNDFDIWINPMSNIKNNNAVYNFGRTGSHISKKNFFIYSKGDIQLLNDSDTENMMEELNTFFAKNNYSSFKKIVIFKK